MSIVRWSLRLVALASVLSGSACVVGDPTPLDLDCEACDVLADQRPRLLRDQLLGGLRGVMGSGGALVGQQRFNLTGIGAGGQWLASADALDRSDVATLVGRHPAVIGIDVWDLAMKPASWSPGGAVHAAAARRVHDTGGVVTMEWHMRGCGADELAGAGFYAAGNEDCLCRLANDDAFARSWLDEGRLARFADALGTYGLDQLPIVFRPLHEMTGDWFWWGYPYWDCARLRPGSTVTGPAAFQKVFRRIVDYLRVERGLDNLAIAYAPDKLDRGVGDTREARYLAGYPGDAYVDVLGIDLYWMADQDLAAQSARYREDLALVTRLARARGKVAALTETGNYRLAAETRPQDSTWFVDHLLPLLRGDGGVELAYALLWENRRNAPNEIYVPAAGHAGEADFRAFAAAPASLFAGEHPDLYGGGAPGAPGSPTAPTCRDCAADSDGDGAGFEDGAACVAPPACEPPAPSYPDCARCDADPDGDGWGWQDERSCIVPAACGDAPPSYPTCARCDSDPDGDGWGWEDERSCVVAPGC